MNAKAHTFDLERFADRAAVDALHIAEIEAGGVDRREGSAFYGLRRGASVGEAVASIVAQGSPEGSNRVTRALKQMADLHVPAVRDVRPVMQHRRVTGQRFNLEHVLAGDVKPWSRFERVATAGSRIISLYVPSGGAVNRDAEEMAWAPVAGLVAADLLEASGYRAEIWLASRVQCNKALSLRALLKASDRPMDLVSLARCATPTLHRGLILSMRKATFGRACDDSYGIPIAIEPGDFNDPDGIALRRCYSFAETVTEIRRVLALFA